MITLKQSSRTKIIKKTQNKQKGLKITVIRTLFESILTSPNMILTQTQPNSLIIITQCDPNST